MGVQRITTGKTAGAMDLPPIPFVEAFSREAEKSKVLLTSFLKLPPVKDLQFALEVGLWIGIYLLFTHGVKRISLFLTSKTDTRRKVKQIMQK